MKIKKNNNVVATISINLIEEGMKMISLSQWREDMTVWPGKDEKCTKEERGVIPRTKDLCRIVII